MAFRRNEIKGADAKKTFHWKDEDKNENIMWRIPRNIEWNDNIVVRTDEYAVFFRDGKILTVFNRPGRYAVTTQNIPVLASLAASITGIRQLGEIYYIQKREMRGKFGTTEPLSFRDSDFGVVRIRAFGDFSYKVVDPTLFISQFVGTEGLTSSEKIIDWTQVQLVTILNDSLGKLKKEKKTSILDLPSLLQEIEQIVLGKASSHLLRYGLELMKIAGLNITLPDELKEAVDKRGAMNALNIDYLQYQTGKAIEGVGKGAAKGGDGAATLAGLGAGLGAGAGIGGTMAKAMTDRSGESKPSTFGKTIKCKKCGVDNPENNKFCSKCGAEIVTDLISCPKCNANLSADAQFCPECGEKLITQCSECKAVIPPNVSFCPSCGKKQ